MANNSLATESIIRAVKHRPCIWNTALKSHCNKSLRDEAWNNLAEDLFVDWDTFTPEQKKGYIIEIKKKWANVRDYFRKETERVHEKKRIYVYSDLLSFLRPYVKKADNGEAQEENDQSSDNSDASEPPAIKCEIEIRDDPLDTPCCAQSSRAAGTAKRTVPRAPDAPSAERETTDDGSAPQFGPLEASVLQLLGERTSAEEDSDLSFFKGIMPEVKALSDEQKFEFKLGTMKLLKKMRSQSTPYFDSD